MNAGDVRWIGCTYCLGGGRVIGPSFFGYLWWRITGRCLTQRCPECRGAGVQSGERSPE